MRLAFVGNIGNTHFAVVRALRDAGIDAHLFVGERDPLAWRPETDDPSLRDGYPDWIREGHWLDERYLAWPWRSRLVRELRNYDVIVASGSAPSYVQFAERPWCFFVTGGDLTVRPFPWAFRERRGALHRQAGHAVLSAWQRRAIRCADQIWTQPFSPFVDALDRLEVDPARITDAYFPLIVDSTVFAPRRDLRPDAVAVRKDSDFVVFHPTRLVFDDSPEMRRSGQWKGSRTLLDGYAEFVARRVALRPLLVMPDWNRSEGVAEAKTIVRQLGIERNVRWATPPRPEGFLRDELVDFYSVADVAVDEFGVGWFGFVSLEAMSCGTPVVSNIDRIAIEKMYGNDWLWQDASTPSGAADRFESLFSDAAQCRRLGSLSREWIERHHAPAAARDRYVAAVSRAVERLRTVSAA